MGELSESGACYGRVVSGGARVLPGMTAPGSNCVALRLGSHRSKGTVFPVHSGPSVATHTLRWSSSVSA
jgi:hypothetical protein